MLLMLQPLGARRECCFAIRCVNLTSAGGSGWQHYANNPLDTDTRLLVLLMHVHKQLLKRGAQPQDRHRDADRY